MIKHKYRIKTEQEFLEEFGPYWRTLRKSRCNFTTGMDYLLGTEIIFVSNEDYQINRNRSFDSNTYIIQNYILDENFKLDLDDVNLRIYNVKCWSVSMDMIKEINIINYNQKKKLVYD